MKKAMPSLWWAGSNSREDLEINLTELPKIFEIKRQRWVRPLMSGANIRTRFALLFFFAIRTQA
jgi:hypothetical protein